jgi:hypothetical protein
LQERLTVRQRPGNAVAQSLATTLPFWNGVAVSMVLVHKSDIHMLAVVDFMFLRLALVQFDGILGLFSGGLC